MEHRNAVVDISRDGKIVRFMGSCYPMDCDFLIPQPKNGDYATATATVIVENGEMKKISDIQFH